MDLEQYYDDIYRYCYLRLNDRHAAEDMAQETFLRFLEASEYRDMGKPLAFLYTIARNLCIDYMRRCSNRPERTSHTEDPGIFPAPSCEGALTDSLALAQALKQLDSMDREIVCLRYINEVPAADIGKIMNLSRFAVRRRLNRSLKLLSGHIKKEDFKS